MSFRWIGRVARTALSIRRYPPRNVRNVSFATALALTAFAPITHAQTTHTWPEHVRAIYVPEPEPVKEERVTVYAPERQLPDWARVGDGWSNSYASSLTELTIPDQPTLEPYSPSILDCRLRSSRPIVFATGNKVMFEQDFSASGEEALMLERVYNSFAPYVGMFGPRWLSTFDYQLGTDASGGCHPVPGQPAACGILRVNVEEITAQRPDGSQLKFHYGTRNGVQGWYTDKPSQIVRLDFQHEGQFANGIYPGIWVLRNEANAVERYTTGGFIKEIKNNQGVGWSFNYGGQNGTQLQSVVHTSGRSIVLGWTGSRVTSVRDPAGNTYSYGYTNGVLVSATAPGGMVTTYHHESAEAGSDAVTGKSINGQRYSIFGYQGALAISSELVGGVERTSFRYSIPDGYFISAAEETNALGKKTTYNFTNGRLVSVTGAPSSHCLGSTRSKTYDAWGYEDKITDSQGVITDFDYDAHGHLRSKVEAYGRPEARATTFEWDESRNLLSKIAVANQVETSYGYTANGRIDTIAIRNLNPNGAVGQTRSTQFSYAYHPNGMLASSAEDGPLPGDTVTKTYSATGDLLSVQNGLGHTTVLALHNGLGQPRRVTTATGAITDYDYDGRGRVVAVRAYPEGVAVEMRYSYGANGLLDAIQSADGSAVIYHYDAARRLIQEDMTAPGGGYEVRRTSYNAMSRSVRVEVGRDN